MLRKIFYRKAFFCLLSGQYYIQKQKCFPPQVHSRLPPRLPFPAAWLMSAPCSCVLSLTISILLPSAISRKFKISAPSLAVLLGRRKKIEVYFHSSSVWHNFKVFPWGRKRHCRNRNQCPQQVADSWAHLFETYLAGFRLVQNTHFFLLCLKLYG